MTRFWNASMGTATIAARLAKETRAADPHVVHTYALFRDCGMPVMLQTRPDYLEVMEGKVVSEVEPIFYVEEERYATTHALIGSTMARSWGLPGDTCLAILQHHHFWHSATSRQQAGPAPQKLVALGIAAEQLHCHRERRTCLEWREAEGWVFETLKLTPASFADLSEAVDEALAA
jgi:HD-like signal output (HDOD) protein